MNTQAHVCIGQLSVAYTGIAAITSIDIGESRD